MAPSGNPAHRVIGRAPCRIALGVTALICAVSPVRADPQFRAFWADAIYEGFKTTSQIDDMVARAVQGNYNAIVAQVMNYQEAVGYRGAYWNSSFVPKAPDIATGLDPLAYLCQEAHAAGIEVHAWIVAFRVSVNWPPVGNSFLAGHPEWLMVLDDDIGGGPAKVDDRYVFDPGSPEVQEHLFSIVRELVTHYPIDGINWDYIRYTSRHAGYPSDLTYENSSLARFQRITGRTDTPVYTDGEWCDFRRRTIDEVVRRCRAEIAAVASNPRQPLRLTADLLATGSAPADFTDSSAYNYHQNWKHWLEMAWLDAGMPMNYKNEATHASAYRSWIDAAVSFRGSRHVYCGQGNYLNTMPNSLTQLQYVYAAGADGSCNYSYYNTTSSGNDWTWYTYIADNLFTEPVPTPVMPWRDPDTASEGTLWGRVTDADTGEPIDDAMVHVGLLDPLHADPVHTDGNGYYVVTLIPDTAGGTSYDVTASRPDYPSPATHPGVTVVAGSLQREDIVLGEVPPCVLDAITGFEGYANGAQVVFRSPRYSGSTDQDLETTPDVSEVTDEVAAFSGGKCGKLQWQYVDGDTARWARITTHDAANVPNPTIVFDRPVRIRLRLEGPPATSLRATLGVRETGTTAPIGDDGGTAGTIEWVGADSKIGTAPQGKLIAARPGLWQTVIFDPSTDPIIAMTGDGILSSPTGKGTLENLAFASTGTVGPFTVYVDDIEQLCAIPIPGDFNDDGHVDQEDVAHFRACLAGADLPPPNADCADADLNGDGDVDQSDFGILQRCLTDSGVPASPTCAQ